MSDKPYVTARVIPRTDAIAKAISDALLNATASSEELRVTQTAGSKELVVRHMKSPARRFIVQLHEIHD